MNKLQQEITEYIKDYMDKTLSEGCLVKMDGGYATKLTTDDDYIYVHQYSSIIEVIKVSKIEGDERKYEEILGHYDITAVLKYINKTNRDYKGTVTESKVIYYNAKIDDIFSIPNKPLHLYSEQENKDLLELFEKLGT